MRGRWYGVPIVLILAAAGWGREHEFVKLDSERQTVQLNFNATYITYIHQDIETMVSLPDGYKYTAVMPGSRDYVSAAPLQNTMYLSCPVDEAVSTNITMHVITPEGAEEKLIFKLKSSRRAPSVYAIHFTAPNTSALNRTVEAMKARFSKQLEERLMKQENVLDRAVHKETMLKAVHWWLGPTRGALSEEHKGAVVIVDGMINSRGNTYVYLRSNSPEDECEIVRLLGVEQRGANAGQMPPELVGTFEDEDGWLVKCYSIPRIEVPQRKKRLRFNVEIWSEAFTIKAKGS